MIYEIRGDLLQAKQKIIAHQVNCKGVMGSGVAKQIKDKYPIAYKKYKVFCRAEGADVLMGRAIPVYDNNKYIFNLFAQEEYGRDGRRYTSYDALFNCFSELNRLARGESVAIPKNIGCGLGGGDWDIVHKIIEKTMTDSDVYIYEL